MKVLFSHWDLDGVVSGIILSQGMKFDMILRGGYQKFDALIEKIPMGADVVVADVCLTVEQFTRVKYRARNVIYIDHHPNSLAIKETFTNDVIVFDHAKAASGLCLDFIGSRKPLSKPIKMLGNAGNFYDLYQQEEQPDWFKFGYDLNILFWEYHYDKFRQRFINGFDKFTPEEKLFIKTSKAKRDEFIQNSVYMEIGESVKGLVCVPADNGIQNDISNIIKGYQVYYIIMRYPKSISISIRSKGIDLNETVPFLKSPYIQSAGGHPQASGLNFYGTPEDEIILGTINELHHNIEHPVSEFDYDDIPF